MVATPREINYGSGSVSAYFSVNKKRIELCRLDYGVGLPPSNSCQTTKVLDLNQIDPDLAVKIRQNKELARLISELERTYGDLKKLLADLDAKLAALSGKSFDELLESDFVGYEQEFSEALKALRAGQKSIADLKAQAETAVKNAVESTKQLQDALDAELKKSGIDLETFDDVDVPEIDDVDVALPDKPDGEDPFDPKNDPYDKVAQTLIDQVQANFPDKRFEIMLLVNAWLKKKIEMDSILSSRSLVSPKELAAYTASIEKVNGYLLQTGCSGKGCFTADWWFVDSPVPAASKSVIQNEIAPLEPARAEKLTDALKTWKGPSLTPQQELVLATIHVLGKSFSNLSSLASDTYASSQRRLQNIADGAVAAAIEAAKTGVQLSPVGDYIEFCEVVTGKIFCNPNGETLTAGARVLSAGALIVGTSTFWRALGDSALGIKAAKGFDKVADSLEKWGSLLPRNKVLTKIDEVATKISQVKLPDNIEKTFLNGDYETYVTKDKCYLFRVFGGTAREEGGFLTTKIPRTKKQAIEDLALLPTWGVTAEKVVLVELQPGVKLHFGKAAPQGSLTGGAEQIYLDIPASEVSDRAKARAYIQKLYSSGSVKILGESLSLGD